MGVPSASRGDAAAVAASVRLAMKFLPQGEFVDQLRASPFAAAPLRPQHPQAPRRPTQLPWTRRPRARPSPMLPVLATADRGR